MCETISNYGFGFMNKAPTFGNYKTEIKPTDLNLGDTITITGKVTEIARGKDNAWKIESLDGQDSVALWAEGRTNWAIGMVEKAKKPVKFYRVLYLAPWLRGESVSEEKYSSLEEYKKSNSNCTPLQILESTMEVRYV